MRAHASDPTHGFLRAAVPRTLPSASSPWQQRCRNQSQRHQQKPRRTPPHRLWNGVGRRQRTTTAVHSASGTEQMQKAADLRRPGQQASSSRAICACSTFWADVGRRRCFKRGLRFLTDGDGVGDGLGICPATLQSRGMSDSCRQGQRRLGSVSSVKTYESCLR